jgi:AraC-like DNA-binding protein
MKLQFEHITPQKGESFVWLHHTRDEKDAYYWHYHPACEIVYVSSGTGRQYVGQHRSFYDEGILILMGSNLPHLNFTYGRKDAFDEIVVQIPEIFIRQVVQTLPEATNIKELLERSNRGLVFDKHTQAQIGVLMKELGQKKGISRVNLLLEILEILATTENFQFLNIGKHGTLLHSQEHLRLNKVFEYVEDNFTLQPKLDDAAQLSNMTTPAFCRFFKKQVGMTFSDFVNETRINQARILLTEGKTVSEAAFESGFNHLGHFTEVFKKYESVNPKDFRKRMMI